MMQVVHDTRIAYKISLAVYKYTHSLKPEILCVRVEYVDIRFVSSPHVTYHLFLHNETSR
jgi:hypothetical protein